MPPFLRTKAASVITAVIFATLVLGCGKFGADTAAKAQIRPLAATTAMAPTRQAAFPDFSDIVDQNGAAVVNISTSGSIKSDMAVPNMPQLDPDDPLYPFFRNFLPSMPQNGMIPIHALGSGFIINLDGIILTNAHVVAGADEVTVKLTDGREFKAKVLGIDKPSDVAVLKINAKNLPTVKIGDASHLRVGDWVLAIGSPFGFENSATAGIVSAKSRSLPDGGYMQFIQTDVPVNPGNSGGPLFNLNGEVVGINSQIYTRSGGYQGLSFAIPINVAMNVAQQLEEHGHIEHGHFGIGIQEVNQSLAESFGLKQPTGALVSSVENGSAAAKAGIEPGDVILGINGKTIKNYNDLPPLAAGMKPGTEAKIHLWHHGGPRDVTVMVGALKDESVASTANHPDKARLGLAVRPLTPSERAQADVKGGLVVEQSSGPAAMAGIESGDIILAVNGTPVASVDQLRTLTAKSDKHVALLVQRGENKLFVPIDLG